MLASLLRRAAMGHRALWTLLFGALIGSPAAGRAKVVDAVEAGPFKLQVVERQSSLQFSANVGFHRVTYYQGELLLRGQTLAVLDGRGGTHTALRAAWVLADAPEPAVLVGGDAWVLVTERDGQPVMRQLSAQDAGTWQWVDTPDGPGREGRNRAQIEPRDLVLRGPARLLLLDRRLLFDVRTLRAQALAQPVPTGFYAPDSGMSSNLMGASPDGRALAFLWERGGRDSLVIVSSTERGESALLPFDGHSLREGGAYPSPAQLLAQHFAWEPVAHGGLPRLVLREAAAPWRLRYLFGLRAPQRDGRARPALTLAPAKPALCQAVLDALLADTDLQRAPVQPGDPAPSPLVFARLRSPAGTPVVLRCDAGTRTLLLESESAETAPWAEQVLEFLGEKIEVRLRAGQWRDLLAAP